jgi:hypothetical protein
LNSIYYLALVLDNIRDRRGPYRRLSTIDNTVAFSAKNQATAGQATDYRIGSQVEG